jgi:hypothetical protein
MLQATMGVPDGGFTSALMQASQELMGMMRTGVPLSPELIQLIAAAHDSQNAGAPCSLATPRPCLLY